MGNLQSNSQESGLAKLREIHEENKNNENSFGNFMESIGNDNNLINKFVNIIEKSQEDCKNVTNKDEVTTNFTSEFLFELFMATAPRIGKVYEHMEKQGKETEKALEMIANNPRDKAIIEKIIREGKYKK